MARGAREMEREEFAPEGREREEMENFGGVWDGEMRDGRWEMDGQGNESARRVLVSKGEIS